MSKTARGRRQAARQRAVQKEARSRAQIEASRINGAKSQGPVTAEGKAGASRNAVRHGLIATQLVMTEEERAWANDFRRDLALRFDPYDTVEMDAIDMIVVVKVKLQRLDQLEGEAISQFIDKSGENEPERRKFPSLDTLGRYRNRLMKEWHEAQARLVVLARQRPEFLPKRHDQEANQNASINEPEPTAPLQPAAARTIKPEIVQPISITSEIVQPISREPDTPVTPPANAPRGFGGGSGHPQEKQALA